MEYAEQSLKLDKALELIEQALENQPENSVFLDTKGWVLHKMGRTKEALEFTQRSLNLNPQDQEIIDHLAIIQSTEDSKNITLQCT
jgi:tetratricopeptide (TPR) repeat protein